MFVVFGSAHRSLLLLGWHTDSNIVFWHRVSDVAFVVGSRV